MHLNAPRMEPLTGGKKGDYHSRRYMENFQLIPPALVSEKQKILDFSPVDSRAKCYEINNIPSQPVRPRTALERRLLGLAPELKGPPSGPGSTNPLWPPLLLHQHQHQHHHHHQASPTTYPISQGRNGCRQDPRHIHPPSPTSPPSSKMVDHNP